MDNNVSSIMQDSQICVCGRNVSLYRIICSHISYVHCLNIQSCIQTTLHIRCGQVARWVGGCGHIAQWVGGRKTEHPSFPFHKGLLQEYIWNLTQQHEIHFRISLCGVKCSYSYTQIEDKWACYLDTHCYGNSHSQACHCSVLDH